jgi:NhaA family Na+:H+ antiporter
MGTLVWLAFLFSGIHATLAGVILGLMTPTKNYIGLKRFRDMLDSVEGLITGDDTDEPPVEQAQKLQYAARETVSPLEFLHAELHPWVTFVIMPVFALANAGVAFRVEDLGSGVAVATMLGLLIGKPVGIVLFTWLAVVLRLTKLPEGVTWRSMTGGACLAGIGFTMALFIASLALRNQMLDQAKLGVLAGSVLSAVLGMGLLWTGPRREENTE